MKSENSEPDRLFETAHLRRNLGRRTIRGGALLLVGNAVSVALETSRVIVLARLLLPTDYGLVAMVTVVTGLVGLFQDMGLGVATVTREKITHAQVSTLFWINVAIGSILVLLVAASAPALAWFYGESRLLAITIVLAPTFLLGALSVQHQALLRRQMRFGTLSAIRVISVASGLAVGIAMACYGAAYWSLVGMTVAATTANLVAVWVASGWRPGLPVRGAGTKAMVLFGGNLTGTNVVGYFSTRLDHFLLGWWWGAAPLGLYTKAHTLVDMPLNRATGPITSVVVPSLSRLMAEPERYRTAYLRVVEAINFVAMPLAAFMLVTAPWLIPLLLGPSWIDSSPIFAALATLGFLRPVAASTRWLFITQDRADEALRWSLIGGGLRAMAVVGGLPWGGLGVAIAIAATSLVRTPLLIGYACRRGPVRASHVYRALAAPALASAGALLVGISLLPLAEGRAPFLVVAAELVVTATVFGAILWAHPAGRRTVSDVWAVLQMFRRDRRIV